MTTLKQLRTEHSMTMAQLAQRTGTSISVIGKMEQGQPTARATIERVLAVFQVTEAEVTGLCYSDPTQVNRKFVQGAVNRRAS